MTWTTRRRSDLGGLAAIVEGTGGAVILLHGVGLRAEAWARQTKALSAHYTVIAPDMPGHGESPPRAGMTVLSHYTDALARALSAPVVVAGHSMGAMIALDLAVRHPGLVRGVAALNAVYRRPAAARTAVMARAGALDGLSPPDPSAPVQRWFGGVASPEAEACAGWLASCDPAGYRAAYRVFAAGDAPGDGALAALPCPALFMTGGRDANSTPAMAAAMAARVPGGRAIVLEDAAHMMPMTHAEAVTAALRDFIEECPA